MTSTAVPIERNARERLLETASRLFYRQGINSTGVDLVLAESGAAKGSLYHHFGGKQGLVLAYLERERDAWLAGAQLAYDPAVDAATRLERMFGTVAAAVRDGSFHGCPFTNAVIERPDDAEVRASVDDYTRRLRVHIATLIDEEASDAVVGDIFVIYNGALTAVKLTRDVAYLEEAGRLARSLIAERDHSTPRG